jgi:hypothetical protein
MDDQLMTGRAQPPRHRPAHPAETDEPDRLAQRRLIARFGPVHGSQSPVI